MRLSLAALVGSLSALCLASCAGTPPPGEQASATHHGRCEHVTGSLLCGNADDQMLSNPNAPNSNTPGVNGTVAGGLGAGSR